MSSATHSGVSSAPGTSSCGGRRNNRRGRSQRWSNINIVAMVIGFVLFWPVGLLVLAWIMSGRDVRDLPGAIRARWNDFFDGSGREPSFMTGSNNVVFNEYQQTQYDRISEIKNEIRERTRRFREFSMHAKRRADQDEFERFMASAPGNDNAAV